MPTPFDHSLLKPPSTTLKGRYVLWAVAVHVLLILALSSNFQWRSETPPPTQAELWQEIPPLPTQPVVPQPPRVNTQPPRVEPPPPRVEPTPPPVDPRVSEAQIALERSRQQAIEREQRAAQELQQRQERDRQQAEEEKKRREAQQREVAERERQQAEEEKKRREAQQREVAERERQQAEEEKKRREAQQRAQREAAERERIHQQQLSYIQRTVPPGSTGNSNTGTTGAGGNGSASNAYSNRLAGIVRSNIAYTGDRTSSSTTRVYVVTDNTGKITTVQISQSSGIPAWDEAVERALWKTGQLPADIDGKRPATSFYFNFTPKDSRLL